MIADKIKKVLAALLTVGLLASSVPACADSVATVTADSLAVYNTPYIETASKVGTIHSGDRVTVKAVSKGIAKISIKDKIYYVDASQLRFAEEAAPSNPATTAQPAISQTDDKQQEATVTAEKLTIYKAASKSAEVLGTANKGAKLNVLSVKGAWAAVRVKDVIGYCAYDGLRISDASGGDVSSSPETPAPVAPTSVPTPAPTQTAAPVPTKGEPATVTADKLVVYKKATKTADTWGIMNRGVSVTVLAVNNTWAAISVAGKIGYCAYAGLSIYPGSAEATPVPGEPMPTNPPTTQDTQQYSVNGKGTCVVQDPLQMYKSPNTLGGSYGTFKAGTQLEVTAVSGEWAKIVYKGKTGYVLRSGLRPVTDVEEPDREDELNISGNSYQTVGSTTLYQKASTSSIAVKVLPSGTKVAVKAISGGWAKIVYNGTNCYAQESNLIKTDQKITGMVVVARAKIYSSTSTGATTLGTVTEGSSIDIYAVSGDWAKVIYNGRTSYMLLSTLFTGTASYTTLKSGDSGTGVQALQNRLETLGYFDGLPSGNYGSITVTAVKRFQEEKGLTVTGIANNATQAALYSKYAPESSILSKTLKGGSKSADITRLQTRLLHKNYYSDSIDGNYGDKTVDAVKAFQKKANLEQTGIANPATLRALFAPGAPTGTISKPAGSNGTPSLDPPNVASDNEDIETVIRYALAQLGKPYLYGANGPDAYDCSGLTYYCFKKVGITLPRSAYDVGYSSALGSRISYEDLKRGDLVCFNTYSDSDLSDHVGIYLGSGKFIHAPHTGTDVTIASMASGYYMRNFSWGRRVIK